MWQFLAFGLVGTPSRRYAIVDDAGAVRWTGRGVIEGMTFCVDHGFVERMEANVSGGPIIHEQGPPPSPQPPDQHVLLDDWGDA